MEWCTLKTDIIDNEDSFVLSDKQEALLKRGNVLWTDFGFNIGSEFGGKHPAVIIRKMGKGIYVIPLDSGKIHGKTMDKIRIALEKNVIS